MKWITTIFKTDVKNLCKHMFSLVIAIGVCFLPALYAWCNIYSNWDPYGNTKGLKMAAVSLDKGYNDDEGNYKNVGDDLIEELKDNDSVDWQFLKTEEEALEGIEKGDYYAAVVVKEDFTYNMYNVFIEDVEEPALIFYQNQKKNPVATKISDTVVEKLQNNINEEFVKVMTEEIFQDANQFHADLQEDGGVDGLIARLEKVNEELQDYQKTIDAVIRGNAVLDSKLQEGITDTKEMEKRAQSSSDSLKEAQKSLTDSQVTLEDYQNKVNITLDTMNVTLTNMANDLNKAQLSNDAKIMVSTAEKCYEDTQILVTDLNALYSALQAQNVTPNPAITQALANIESMMGTVEQVQDLLNKKNLQGSATSSIDETIAKEAKMAESLQEVSTKVVNLQNKLNQDLIPQIRETITNLENVLGNASSLMENMGTTIQSMGNVFGSLSTTVNCASDSLEKTKEALEAISNKLTKAIEKANKVQEDEKVQALLETLAGNPELYGEFFSEPVEIETHNIYPVENYGSAVAPFYTVLAIWVGALILTAILKVKPSVEKYPNAKPYQLYFGRYLIFLVMGQIQTLITVLGNFWLLGIQCIHPFLFWLASAIISLTFSLLIYSLVVAFGDVGKAIAVVVVVIQIAGSSGTYPIELLPEFFQRIYIFFPFPYGINALRECICGMYEADYVIYLLELSIFIFISLVIGLLIRKPFEGIMEYMEKRMEDTKIF